MQTYSHVLVNAAAGRGLQDGRPGRYGAFVLGALLPDVPLLLLSAGFLAARAAPLGGVRVDALFGASYGALYFQHPVWVASHNLLHAPLVLIAMAAVGAWGVGTGRSWGGLLSALVAGAMLHALVDVVTHHGDGPLLLFPLEWSVRFESPVSYWNPGYGGGLFAAAEHALDLAILGWLGRRWWVGRRGAEAAEGS